MTKALMACVLGLMVMTAAVMADAPKAEPAKPKMSLIAGGADCEKLKGLLEGLGHEVAEEPMGTVRAFYLKIKAGKYHSVHTRVALSPTGAVIWARATLATAEFDKAPAAVLHKMMEKNADMSPALFARDGKVLHMQTFAVNKDFNAKKLKDLLDWLAKHVDETDDLWNDAKWPKAGAK